MFPSEGRHSSTIRLYYHHHYYYIIQNSPSEGINLHILSLSTADTVCSRPDLENLVGARCEQVSSGGLIVHVNNAVLAVMEGGGGRSTRRQDRGNGGYFIPDKCEHKGSVYGNNRGWLLLTPRRWWTRGSCHTRAPQTQSPWGGWWSVWTNICHTLPGRTSCSGAEETQKGFMSALISSRPLSYQRRQTWKNNNNCLFIIDIDVKRFKIIQDGSCMADLFSASSDLPKSADTLTYLKNEIEQLMQHLRFNVYGYCTDTGLILDIVVVVSACHWSAPSCYHVEVTPTCWAEDCEVPVLSRSSYCPTSVWSSRRKVAHTSDRSHCPATLGSVHTRILTSFRLRSICEPSICPQVQNY